MNRRHPAPSELPALFRSAAESDAAAVVRLAAAMEGVDRDEDAVRLWRLAAELGDTLATGYLRDHVGRDGVLQRPHWDGMVTDVLDLQREHQASLVDHDWLDKQLEALMKIPLCHIHRKLEPDGPDDYKACGECFHVWRTREEFAADVEKIRRELDAHVDAAGDLRPTSYVPVVGDLGVAWSSPAADGGDDPWTVPPADGEPTAALTDEDICPLCTHTF